MKTLRLLLALVLVAALPLAADAVSPNDARSSSRYLVIQYPFSTTASISGGNVATLPAGMRLVDVVVYQNAAGTGGTSWVATPKRNTTALVSTAGGFTLAAGATKVTNSSPSPLGVLSLPSGGTRPVIAKAASASGTITVSASITDGQSVTVAGRTYTARTAPTNAVTEWTLSGTANTDATRLAALINADPGAGVVATPAAAVVTVKAKPAGALGNTLGLSKSGAQLAVSGANLTGGFDYRSANGDLVTMDITLTGTYTVAVSGVVTLYFEPLY